MVLLSFSLFWIRDKHSHLRSVAAANEHHASRLFGVHQMTLRRNGGQWLPDCESQACPKEVSDVYQQAMRRPGVVFEYCHQWLPCRQRSVKRSDLAKVDVTSPALGVRTLRLTPHEKKIFETMGGGEWLRKTIRSTNLDEAISPTRSRSASSMPISFRISDDDWMRFQMLGGKTWLLFTLSRLAKSGLPRSDGHNV